MTPTNVSLGELDPAHLCHVDPTGRVISGERPTKEAFLHRVMYAARQATQAVVHLHSTYSVAVSCLRGLDPCNCMPPLTAYYVMRVGRLPLVSYFPPGDPSLAVEVEQVAANHHAVLLANHGSIVAGTTLSSAMFAIEELEQTARLFLLLRHEQINALTEAQVLGLRSLQTL